VWVDDFLVLQLLQLGRDDDLTVARVGIGVIVTLMIILSRVEFLEGHDFRHDRTPEIILRSEL